MIFWRKPKKIETDEPYMVVKQGWNEPRKQYWIQITNRRSGLTLRRYMTPEEFANLHSMGFRIKQFTEAEAEEKKA